MTKDMYQAMFRIIKKRNKKEKFIKSNWLDMSAKIKSSSIDVVIGDFVIGNMGGFENKFLKEIKRVLKIDGNFITRMHYRDKNKFKTADYYKELEKLSDMVKLKKISIKEASSYFAMKIIFSDKSRKVSISLHLEKIKNLVKEIKSKRDIIIKKIFKQFKKSWWLMKDKYWTNYEKKALEGMVKKHFKIAKVLYSHDYDMAKVSPIYLLKK
ncbi:hypothetical protein AUJ27_02785 [Candidatus Falkowbacteria bacterium CG1_02_37_44]|uniref:Methyltransferase type 11 domain-containing protein n=2 Tax=Candidatus Falkowiibacteriota TaxID=1752728 RepID=A0A1J4T913_9BACT|nr:MAG: hypothetical protein AUJ27_02785 [Candidatus Falkowbacteria bacterium CG1_02_37_44]PIV51785.1 MAG: hypothetical protein COS18_01930 [Candidatus Falkowbacteria bacterium CG02_land_8_20_14_3_00_36_14]